MNADLLERSLRLLEMWAQTRIRCETVAGEHQDGDEPHASQLLNATCQLGNALLVLGTIAGDGVGYRPPLAHAISDNPLDDLRLIRDHLRQIANAKGVVEAAAARLLIAIEEAEHTPERVARLAHPIEQRERANKRKAGA